jgi:hypothetical protein
MEPSTTLVTLKVILFRRLVAHTKKFVFAWNSDCRAALKWACQSQAFVHWHILQEQISSIKR